MGETLTADGGEWDPADAELAYQWFADAEAIEGAAGSTLELTAALEGAMITVEVTASAEGFESATAVAEAVGPVAAAADAGDGAGDDDAGGQDGDGSGAGGGSELPTTGAEPGWAIGALAALMLLAGAALVVIRRRIA